jgi:hypothetical protein
MTDKQKVKNFLVALSKDDYVTANKIFPEVVKSSIKTLINNKKQDVIDNINTKVEASISLLTLDDEENKPAKEG